MVGIKAWTQGILTGSQFFTSTIIFRENFRSAKIWMAVLKFTPVEIVPVVNAH